MPRVSAIIPCYNGAHYLPDALGSALRQTFMDYELMIVDDGSTDATRSVAMDWVARAPHKIKYIHQENKGLAAARNTAIAHSTGEFLALLDCDDLWMPDHLEESVGALDANPRAALAHANIVRVNERKDPIGIPRRDERVLGGKIFNHLYTRRAHVACPTAIFRRQATEQVGPFDENLSRLGCEDRDLWLRLAREFEVAYIPKELALYRVSPASMSRNLEKMLQARLYVMEKHAGVVSAKTRREGYAALYREMAESHQAAGNQGEARDYYLRAFRANPLGGRPAASALWHMLKS